MVKYEEILINVKEGDLISSKKGFLGQSPISKKWYIYYKAKYLGSGGIEVIGDKIACDIKNMQEVKPNSPHK